MIILRDSTPSVPKSSGAVVALGNFDGLHQGHAQVIGTAVSLARSFGKPAMVMTFEPHPRRLFRPELPHLRILTLNEKIHQIKQMQVDFLRVVRFTRAFSETPAEDFIRRTLHEALQVSHVVTGEDFVFGHNREGNARTLRSAARELGFAATTCPPVAVDGARCSSTRIREALTQGDMEKVARLLGRPYAITRPVLHGDKRGRVLGFPTANLQPPPIFLPAYGVYAVKAHLRGQTVRGVANLGIRPDYPLKTPLLEAHLFDWREEVYGERMKVEFVHYLRGERKFSHVDALKAQMAEDCIKAKSILAGA